jgi:2-amino-4-hydroxy-6-hydroxymethyldihydropteridine diphosphokinase
MIFSSTFFPYHKKSDKFRHKALIGIGCNVGNCIRRFKKLFLYLNSHPKLTITDTSILYKNPPFGYLDQDDFINSVMIIKTNLSPKELLYFLLRTEKKFKRKRTFKNAPRTLDLDIIMYDDIVYKDKKLILPHPFFKKRDSVVLPMYYLGVKK